MFFLRVLAPLFLQWFMWPFVRPLFCFFGRWEIRGLEHICLTPKGAIFASNHTSELDAVLIPAALPFFSRFRPFFYTSREQSFYIGASWRRYFYGGILFKLLGAYPLLPGKQNYQLSLATHINIAKQKQSVIIFPEGRVGHNNTVQEGKGGVSYISYKTKIPIIPVAISGTYELSAKAFFSRSRKINITFGQPMQQNELFPLGIAVVNEQRNDFKVAAQKVIERIKILDRSLNSPQNNKLSNEYL